MLTRNYIQFYNVLKTFQKLPYRSHSIKSVTPVFKKASAHSDRIALKDEFGKYTYGDLLRASSILASEISNKLDGKVQERVGLLCPNNASYVIAQWACWISGQIVVPLCPSHPPTILQHFISDSQTSLIIADPQYMASIESICSSKRCTPYILDPELRTNAMYKPEGKTEENEDSEVDLSSVGKHSDFYSTNEAMILYTSGSTGLPKGVVLSHSNLEAQIQSMTEAWAWEDKDCILHTLPLYHTHGIVNALLVPLYVGAKCVMLREFDASQVWAELVGIKTSSLDRVTLFTGVPTMYAKLIQEFENKLDKSDRISDYVKQTCSQKIRLMMCGSAPLPKGIFDRWHEITGHKLVERYGMTETGMILSAPLSDDREYGNVGVPMPGVQVRIVVDERDGSKRVVARGTRSGTEIQAGNKYSESSSAQPSFRSLISDPSIKESITGVLHVSGDTVASRYWNRPQATATDFKSGWFNTGDIVQLSEGKYTIMGRVSSDIIKTGGFKVSALQVETVISEFESIADVAVVPLEDPVWGEKIGLLVVVKEGMNLDVNKLKSWASERLPEYAMPRIIVEADGVIPRNHMGKVNRSQLKELFFIQPPRHASASA